MKVYWLTLGILTVWRVTHFLQAEDGPWGVVVVLRRKLGGGFFGKLLDCFYCLSIWISAPVAILLSPVWSERAWLWPALSAGAILLERVTSKEIETALPFYHEDAKSPDLLLRKTEGQPPSGEATKA